MLTKEDREEMNRVLDNMTDEEFEQALIDAGIENCPEISSEEDKGFEIKCLNCGSTDCNISEMGDYNYEEEWEGSGIFEITCRNCGQCQ